MIDTTKSYLKDLNDNNLTNLSANPGKSKKYFHFAEKPTEISNPKLLYSNQSEGLQSVLLSPPREETIVNYPIGNGIDQQYDKATSKALILDDGYEQPLRSTNTVNPSQLSTQMTDGVKSGKTISVSTCQCCGNESKPIVGGQNKYTWKYLTDIKTLRGKKYQQHVDSFSRGSTPIEGYRSTNNAGRRERYNNSLTSQSRKVSPISWKSTSTSSSNIKGLQLKGCHVCNRSRPYSFSSSRTNSFSKKNDNDCPYSIVLGSLHPTLHSYKSNYRSTGNVINRSTRKDETRRSLIMIFTITSILLFLMMSYYGTIIYLRLKNSKSQ